MGWTGMAFASSLAHFNYGEAGDRGLETVEIGPQNAEGLGLALGDVVRALFSSVFPLTIGIRILGRDWTFA